MKRRTLIQILGASALTSTLGMLTQPAAAQSTAGLIVPFPAGGGADVLARSIADAFGRELGLTFWTANHPGAGGTLGAQYLSRQHPDGGYVGYVTNGILCVNPLLTQKHLLTLWRHLSQWDESLRLVSLPYSILMPLKV